MKTAAVTFALGAFLAVSAEAQMGAYLDYYVVKVKPEKRADFENVAKKIVEANRKNGGDTWLTFDTMYGDNDTMAFVSTRKDVGAIDTANDMFMKALKDAYGDGAEAVLHDFNACISSGRGVIRKRRPDLSFNAPANDDDYAKLIGEARYIRTTTVRFKPGHPSDTEELFGMIKQANAKSDPSSMMLVSQAIAGDAAGTYYISSLGPSIGSLDSTAPPLKEVLGEEDFAKYEKIVADSVISSESTIAKIRPELSNPPAPVVEVSRDFWTPQAMPTTAARSKKKGQDKTASK